MKGWSSLAAFRAAASRVFAAMYVLWYAGLVSVSVAVGRRNLARILRHSERLAADDAPRAAGCTTRSYMRAPVLPLTRRQGLALLLPWPLAQAQGTFPTRPMTLVVPFGPGGIADLTARAVAKEM